MKITDKIEGYAEMTAEEKLSALEALDMPENDDLKLKEALNKATAEASSYKKALREKQTEQERLEAERKEEAEKREALLNSLLKEKNIAEHKANFLKQGYDEELATSSATALIDGDFGKVFDDLSKFIESRDKKKEVERMDATRRPIGGTSTPEITKEQFNKMTFSERNKLYVENAELYETLSKGD